MEGSRCRPAGATSVKTVLPPATRDASELFRKSAGLIRKSIHPYVTWRPILERSNQEPKRQRGTFAGGAELNLRRRSWLRESEPHLPWTTWREQNSTSTRRPRWGKTWRTKASSPLRCASSCHDQVSFTVVRGPTQSYRRSAGPLTTDNAHCVPPSTIDSGTTWR